MAEESKRLDLLTTIGTLMIAATGIVALWYAHATIEESRAVSEAQISESRNQAQIQHLDQLVQRFEESAPLLEARKNLARSRINKKQKQLIPFNPDSEPDAMDTLLDFFDYLGLLEKRGYLSKADVYDQFGYYLFAFYEDAKPTIAASQKSDTEVWANVTSLMNDLQTVDALHQNVMSKQTTQNDLYALYESEMDAQTGQPVPKGKEKK
jgi:hypothetical protein